MPLTLPPVLLVQSEGPVTILRFNRPAALNAIDIPMAHALLAAIKGIAADPKVHAVVPRGEGKGFMAGGDLTTLAADPVQGAIDLITPLNEAVNLMHSLNAPVIAQVRGVVAGAGLSLMLQADFVLAAEGTRFNLAYINLGSSCDVGASWALPRLVGLRKALEIAMLGETFDAAEAQRLGLISRLLPVTELDAAVAELAERLAKGPTVAFGHMRRLMRNSFDADVRTQLAAEAAAFDQCARTTDLPEGIRAFLNKQAPVFQGR
jgi:2-(1,2-epoxy-1,2-dihydrophenyl)acetyl-CoA isomerase